MTNRQACCSFPQGRQAVFSLAWSIVSFVFTLSASSGCWFMRIDGYLDFYSPYYIPDESEEPVRSSIGPLGFQEEGSGPISFACLSYSGGITTEFMDGKWRASRTFAILGIVLGGLVLAGMIALSCVAYNKWVLRAFSVVAVLGGVSESLVFLLFGSKLAEEPYNGSFFIGAGVAIFAFLLWLATAVTILLVPSVEDAERVRNVRVVTPRTEPGSSPSPAPAPSHKRNFPAPARRQEPPPEAAAEAPVEQQDTEAFLPGTETITETVLPDGSKKVTKVVVEADGSQYSTSTIVHTKTS